MPFTPFHFGPGAALKAAMPRHFSFMVYAFAQVATDLEVLFNFARPAERLHGFMHTPIGAVIVGATSVGIGWPVCQLVLKGWHYSKSAFREHPGVAPRITPTAAITGAFVGSFSHLFLDSIMHEDVRPFFPWTDENPFHGLIGIWELHLLCLVMALFGTAIYALAPRRSTKQISPSPERRLSNLPERRF